MKMPLDIFSHLVGPIVRECVLKKMGVDAPTIKDHEVAESILSYSNKMGNANKDSLGVITIKHAENVIETVADSHSEASAAAFGEKEQKEAA